MTPDMSSNPIIATTHFKINPADSEELRTRHTAMVSALRAAVSGPREARLGRIDEETWIAIWRWDSAEHMRMAQEQARKHPEVDNAFALISVVTGEAIELIDER